MFFSESYLIFFLVGDPKWLRFCTQIDTFRAFMERDRADKERDRAFIEDMSALE